MTPWITIPGQWPLEIKKLVNLLGKRWSKLVLWFKNALQSILDQTSLLYGSQEDSDPIVDWKAWLIRLDRVKRRFIKWKKKSGDPDSSTFDEIEERFKEMANWGEWGEE
jgi:hypothetical protein